MKIKNFNLTNDNNFNLTTILVIFILIFIIIIVVFITVFKNNKEDD